LRVEEIPRLLVRAELLLIVSRQRARLVFVRVDCRLLVAAVLEGAQAGGLHPAELRQLRDAGDVDRAPGAALFSRGEADAVADVIDAAPYAVDPAEGERLVDRFRPGDRRLAGVFLVEADQELGGRGVVLRQPFAEIGGRFEKVRLHRHRIALTREAVSNAHPNRTRRAE